MNLFLTLLCWFKRLMTRKRAPSEPGLMDQSAFLDTVCSADRLSSFPTLECQIRARLALGSRAPGRREAELHRLQTDPEAALVGVFAHDGFVREAAVKALRGPLQYPFVVYGLMTRLNDWVPQVRVAAWQALDRGLATSDPQILAPVVWLTLQHGTRWRRWGEALDALVDSVALHPGVLEALVDLLVSPPRSGATTVFQDLSRSSAFDLHLRKIAAKAQTPHLRAVALNVLIEGRAVWPTGLRTKHWVDKSLGISKIRPEYAIRALSFEVDRAEVLAGALGDKAWVVRREALDALTRHRSDPRLMPVIADCLLAGRGERVPSLRSRLDYLAAKATEGAP